MGTDGKAIREAILDAVAGAAEKVMPRTLEKRICAERDVGRTPVRVAIRDLVETGELAYTYGFGRTFLEISFNRPVRVSDTVVLKPPGVTHAAGPRERVITLQAGAAFGTGAHPTTRLSLKGIEFLAERGCLDAAQEPPAVLDIGTGSGVLAIAALRFGAGTALGLDIDPCAIGEARENVRLNGMAGRITIEDRPPDTLGGGYALVTANLRYPTLRTLYPTLLRITTPDCCMVFSGIKEEEVEGVLALYTESHFECLKSESEKGWACVVLARIPVS